MILIRNGLLHDMEQPDPYVADILIKDGKIAAIGEDLYAAMQAGDFPTFPAKADAPAASGERCGAPAPSDETDLQVIEAAGLDIYPGFVDAHTHLGLDGYAIGFEGQDYNEMNDIISPQLRGIDSFNPLDPAVAMAAKAGVTCVGTGPGSANVLGGTFFAVKTVGRCVDDMIVRDPVAMKCAFGENPKRVYKEKGNYARMSTAAKLREALLRAKDYGERKEAAGDDPLKRPTYDMKMEALLPVLAGEIPLKAHAHQANDILTAIRIAREFGVRMTLEHVTEGHLIVQELVAAGMPCAVGPSLGHASKFELQNKSWVTPGILAAAGISVSIITDAGVIPQWHLPLCAALAVQAGMEPADALRAITINPARHLGIEDRVGSLKVGKDADILLYDADPLDGISTPKTVLIDGKVLA